MQNHLKAFGLSIYLVNYLAQLQSYVCAIPIVKLKIKSNIFSSASKFIEDASSFVFLARVSDFSLCYSENSEGTALR